MFKIKQKEIQLKRIVQFIGILVSALFVIVFASPAANATHTLPLQPQSTMVLQNMTPGSAYSNDLYLTAEWYSNNIPGHPVNMPIGSCQTGFMCVRVWIENAGATGWDGSTTPAAMCGSDYCTWPTSSVVVVINTYYTPVTGHSNS